MNDDFNRHKSIKDTVIYLLIFIIIAIIAATYFKNSTSADILEKTSAFIGMMVVILFGILGVFDFLLDNGLYFIVPNSYVEYKEDKQRKQTKKYLDEFFIKETEYFMQYGNKRIEYFLGQLGLTRSEFEEVKLNILRIKLLPLSNIEDARNKIQCILSQRNVVLSQRNVPSTKLVYKEVKYFANFVDIMYSDDYANEISDCLVLLIKDILKKNLTKINKVVIPYNSNFLLGLGVSRKINIPMVRITEKPNILFDQSWEGSFKVNEETTVIIVHDVLVTGDQVIKSIEKIPNSCSVIAIFCLINRLDYNGKSMLESKGYTVHSLVELSDSDLEKMVV